MKNICFKTCTILVALFIGITLHAQQISVKGTVVEKSTGLSVIGASVIEVGSENNGTITDIDGNFSLTVSQGSELSVSYRFSSCNGKSTTHRSYRDDGRFTNVE